MKLYTEEQVRQSLMKHQNASMLLSIEQIDYLIKEITPIELPSEEEIKHASKNNSAWEYNHVINFTMGVLFVMDKINMANSPQLKDKIQGGNI